MRPRISAAHAGLAALRGTYVPSAKNSQVAGLYERFGFAPAGTDEDGTTHWELALPAPVSTAGLIAVERVVDLREAVPGARHENDETVGAAR